MPSRRKFASSGLIACEADRNGEGEDGEVKRDGKGGLPPWAGVAELEAVGRTTERVEAELLIECVGVSFSPLLFIGRFC